MTTDYAKDVAAISGMIDDMFSAISWSEDTPPDWDRFAAPCLGGAKLFPSARPVSPADLAPFMEMMTGQRDNGNMTTFEEVTLGHHIRVFGNIAIALSSFETVINGGEPSRGVNGFLLIRNEGEWKIVAMCWDSECDKHALPDYLL